MAVENSNAMYSDSLPTRTSEGPWDHVISALAYFTFIPAVVFLLTAKFRNSRLVRFHSLQSILLAGAIVVSGIAVRTIFAILSFVPGVAFLVGWLAAFIATLGFFILWIVLVVKALRGEMFEVPLLGKIATRQSA
jgi:uncharacterized membrane protein